ncbi:hypothetical protein [Massilia psychrophila]|nr:hypothetical protein [Massilia psychrophila]
MVGLNPGKIVTSAAPGSMPGDRIAYLIALATRFIAVAAAPSISIGLF